ncbi:hypothetical protein ACEPPN_012176 [Leptodophora sp. 'Broadleaf-Isolate-01']
MARLNSGVAVKAAAAPRRPKTYGHKRTILAETDNNQRVKWQKIKDGEKKEKGMAEEKESEQDDEAEETKKRDVDAGDDKLEHDGGDNSEAEEESDRGRADGEMEGLDAGHVESDDFNVMRSAGGKAEMANLQGRKDGENGRLEAPHVEVEASSMDQDHGSEANEQGNITGRQDIEVERLEARVVETDDINMDQDGGREGEQQDIVQGLKDNESERPEAQDTEVADASAGQDTTEDEEAELLIIKHIVATEMRTTKESYPKAILHALIQWEGYADTSDMTWEVMPNAVVDWKPYYKRVWVDKEYVMTRVWASRKAPKGKEYLVEWDEYSSVKDLTWEPGEVVRTTFAEGLQAYLAQKALD